MQKREEAYLRAGDLDVQKVEVVGVSIPKAGLYNAGWGYVEFTSHRAACQAFPRQALIYS